MKDETLFKISMATAIIGLIGLLITSSYVNPEELTINKIDNSKLDNQVQITGIINSHTLTKSGTHIINIQDDTGVIDVVVFSTTDINITFNEGTKVTIIGKVTRYDGKLELILEESKNIKIDS